LRSPLAWPFFAYLAFYPAVYYVTHATLRYRHPVDPALTVLASYAIACAVRAVARRNTWFYRAPGLTTRSGAISGSPISQ